VHQTAGADVNRPFRSRGVLSEGLVADQAAQTLQLKGAFGLPASPAQFFSFCKKPDDLSERGAILPEKLVATFEHAQGRSWDSSHHTLL